MKVLITGSTGFIGNHLVRRLAANEHQVRVLVRSLLKFDDIPVEVVCGDIAMADSLAGICKGVDVVFHLAGILGQWGKSEQVYWDINVKGTENILRECLNSGVKRFIYCSTAGVVGPTNGKLMDESYPYNPSNIYEKTKCEAEKMVREFYSKYGLPIVVIRPEFIYGPGDMHVLGLFRAIKKGIFPIIGGGRSTLHPTYIDDLISGFELGMKIDNAMGNTYFIAGEEVVSVKRLAEAMAKAMGVSLPQIYLPEWVTRAGASILEPVAKVLNIESPLNHAKINFFTQPRGVSILKARKELGYNPQVGLEEGLKKTVEWYQSQGYL
ncbi:NAD-dependent epimerase/dehydratase family protein [Candidatus Desantisbacteria bacterium]|nr:NAD-dependent epimerase/dehydratase family protein [Candidatus Desantisbacteria bacterium]